MDECVCWCRCVCAPKIAFFLSHLSRSLADRWGTAVDFTTSFPHSSRFSAFRSMIFHSRSVHSLMLSSHRFLCLPLRLPPRTVPCMIKRGTSLINDFQIDLFTFRCIFIFRCIYSHLFVNFRSSSNMPYFIYHTCSSVKSCE